MTPLQFAARCAIGLVFDIPMSVVRIDTGLNERVSVFWRLPRAHSVKAWELWREVFGVSVAEQEREFRSAEWEDAILSALTEKHATATHIALPDGSVPVPDMHGWRFGGAVPVPDLGGVCAICGLFEKDIAHTSGREDACRFVDEASLIVADSRAIGDGSVPQVVTDARTEVHRVGV
jgi:hypothetical protein